MTSYYQPTTRSVSSVMRYPKKSINYELPLDTVSAAFRAGLQAVQNMAGPKNEDA